MWQCESGREKEGEMDWVLMDLGFILQVMEKLMNILKDWAALPGYSELLPEQQEDMEVRRVQTFSRTLEACP